MEILIRREQVAGMPRDPAEIDGQTDRQNRIERIRG